MFKCEETDTTSEDVLEEFDHHCLPQSNEVFERFKFFSCSQKDGQSIDAYLTELKTHAAFCNFGEQETSLIRDRIVLGVKDVGLQERLLREPKLTLQKAVDSVQACEFSRKQVKTMNDSNSKQACGMIKSNEQSYVECQACGRKHIKDQCPAYNELCNKGKEKNNFAVMCKSKSVNKNICSIEDNYRPPSIIRVYTLQPPTNSSSKTEKDDDRKGDYKCGWESCDDYFNCKKDLTEHVNNTHICQDENSLYRCHWNGCVLQGKAIEARCRMLVHIRTHHTHERPFGCVKCGKRFFQSENLKVHFRTHTGEKPYTCPVAGCNKAYSNCSDRLKHVKTHLEDKPYVCRVEGCDKRYTDPSSLRKHMRSTAHGGKNRQKPGVTSQVTRNKNGDLQNNSKDFHCSPLRSTT